MAEAWSSTAGAGLGPAHGQDRGWGRVPMMSNVRACVSVRGEEYKKEGEEIVFVCVII